VFTDASYTGNIGELAKTSHVWLWWLMIQRYAN